MTTTTVLIPLLVLVLGRLVVAVVRFVRLPADARRYWLAARWQRFRWRWFCRNAGLGYLDHHHRRTGRPRIPFTTGQRVQEHPVHLMRFPRAHFRPDAFGLVATVTTIPKVGRSEFEAAAPWLADQFRAHRVQVSQPEPGRLVVRGLRRDPLAEPLAAAVLPPFDGRHVTLGRDEWGDVRRVSLAGHAGSVWAGNPGRGKSECALSLAVQLVPSPLVDFWVLDGGAADWSHFAHGAAGYVDDDLEAAEDLLATLDHKMRARRRSLEIDLGVRNGWLTGPTPDYRIQWLLVEESPFYLSLDGVKGDKKREAHVVACRGFIAQLLRRGRAPMFHTSLLGQKITSTSIPPDLRDLCGLRWSFGTSTMEAAAACLGADIRQHPTACPTLLQSDDLVGVASVLLPTGQSPYTLLRFPAIGEALADKIALDLATRPVVPAAVPAAP
jgi:hypothetical protein